MQILDVLEVRYLELVIFNGSQFYKRNLLFKKKYSIHFIVIIEIVKQKKQYSIKKETSLKFRNMSQNGFLKESWTEISGIFPK